MMRRMCSSLTSSLWRDRLEHVDIVLFDCDGVVWNGPQMIEGASAAISSLRNANKMVKFITNNSLVSRRGLAKKFQGMGIDVGYQDIYTAGYAAAAYLASSKASQKAFVIGHSGITEELEHFGIPYVAGQSFDNCRVEISPGGKIMHDPSITSVIVGADIRFNYYKIQYAQLCLNLNENCSFLATNDDPLAGSGPLRWAEAGAMVGAIRGCTGKEPVLVGKPSSFLVDHILGLSSDQNRDNTSDSTSKGGNSSSDSNSGRGSVCGRERVCMVGDNLQTDILFGLSSGLQTVLVLSGVTSQQQLLSEQNQIRPHYYCNSIADLVV